MKRRSIRRRLKRISEQQYQKEHPDTEDTDVLKLPVPRLHETIPTEDLIREKRRGFNRRELLKRGAVMGAVAALAGPLPLSSSAANGNRVVIIGAGLAGMTAAYRISQQPGYLPIIFEAQSRIGGRTRTIRGLPGGQWAEAGAQSINTNETIVQDLMGEIGVGLLDTFADWPNGEAAYHIDGQYVDWSQVEGPLNSTIAAAESHFQDLVWPVTYDINSPGNQYWDGWSVAEWIDTYCPGGINSPAGQLLVSNFENDYAGPVDEASAIHIIADFGGPGDDSGADERWTVQNGTDSIVNRLEELIPSQVTYDTPLVALRKNARGTYRCTVDYGGTLVDVVADHVVLAVPFTALQDVDLSQAGLSPLKLAAIQQLGMGINAKLNFSFNGKPWEGLGADGSALTDTTMGATWPGHVGMPGSQGLLTTMNSNSFTLAYGSHPAHGPASQQVVNSHLAAVDNLFPGSSPSFNGTAYLDNWPQDPWVKGSYAYYKVGTFTSFGGIEPTRDGNIHFAGEHTAALDLRATMNGAVESGNRAAAEVLENPWIPRSGGGGFGC